MKIPCWVPKLRSPFVPRCYQKTKLIVSPPAGTIGTPYGSFDLWTQSSGSATLKSGGAVFTFSQDSCATARIVAAINAARANGTSLVLMLTGGGHTRYINTLTTNKFDVNYWKHGNPSVANTGMDEWNVGSPTDPTTIKGSIMLGLADGTVLGLDIMDEPQAQSWSIPAGPSGVTRQNIDDMVAYAKGIFGATCPVGISTKTDYHDGAGDAAYNYLNLDFITTQYIEDFGDCATWRDTRLSEAATLGVNVIFSYNVLNGGAGFGETALTCATVSPPDNLPTGGLSPIAGDRCSMGTQQLEQFLAVLMAPDGSGRKAIAAHQWAYNSTYYTSPPNQSSFAVNAALCASRLRAPDWLR